MLLKIEGRTLIGALFGYLVGIIAVKRRADAPRIDEITAAYPLDTLLMPTLLQRQYQDLVGDLNFMNSISDECREWLMDWESRTTFVSQVSQDWWLFANAFRKKGGFFIDLGAHQSREWSNTYFFERCLNWRGICVEANPTLAADFKGTRSCILEQTCISDSAKELWFKPDGPVGEALTHTPTKQEIERDQLIKVPCTTLDNLFHKHKVQNVDFISIDVEGSELSVMSTFTQWHKVDWIVAETMWSTMHLGWLLADKGFWRVSDIGGADDVFVRGPVPMQPTDRWSNRDLVYRLVETKQNQTGTCVNGG